MTLHIDLQAIVCKTNFMVATLIIFFRSHCADRPSTKSFALLLGVDG
jgi:hypothetical protein